MREIGRNIVLTSLLLAFICILPDILIAQTPDSTSSWLKVLANLEQYYVVIDKDFKHPYLLNRGERIKVSPGKRHVTVVWRNINDQTFTILVRPGETRIKRVQHVLLEQPRTSYHTIVNQTNLLITTEYNSTIYINDEEVGKHTVQTLVNPGSHILRIEHPEYGSLNKRIKVNSLNVTEVARVNKNPSNLPFAAKLLPGAEYLASKRYKMASITYLTFGLLTANLIKQNRAYSKKYNSFNELEMSYQNATTTSDAIYYRKNAIKARDDLDRISKSFNLTLFTTAGVYILSTLHALKKPKSGYRGKSKIKENLKINASAGMVNQEVYPALTFKYQFK